MEKSHRSRGIVNARLPLTDQGLGLWTIIIKDDRVDRVFQQSDATTGCEEGFLDARKRPVLPGFVDAHMHPISLGLKELRLDLATVTGLRELIEIVGERVQTGPFSEGWLVGYDWDESRFRDERRYPTRWDLDRASRDVPIALQRTDGHLWVVNSKALEKINPPADDPLVYKTDGEPNGLIADQAIRYLEPFVEPKRREKRDALRKAEEQCLRHGITTVADMYADLEVYEALLAEGRPRVRFTGALPPSTAYQLKAPLPWTVEREGCFFPFVKLFLDGSIGARTAALRTPYWDDPSETGRLFLRDRSCEGLILNLNEEGWSLAVHCIGDLAIDQAIEAFRFLRMEGSRFFRHRLEHLELIHRDQIGWLKKLHLVPSLQPNFISRWQGPGGLYETRLGKDRTLRMNPLRSVLEAGLPLAFGSDGMPLGPFFGIFGALTHPNPEERISLRQALGAYTQGAAFACRLESCLGTIAPGFLADLIVLSRLPDEEEYEREWQSVEVQEVVVGGCLMVSEGKIIGQNRQDG